MFLFMKRQIVPIENLIIGIWDPTGLPNLPEGSPYMHWNSMKRHALRNISRVILFFQQIVLLYTIWVNLFDEQHTSVLKQPENTGKS